MQKLITKHLQQYNQELSRINHAIQERLRAQQDIADLQRLADIVGAKIIALHDLEDNKEVTTEVFPLEKLEVGE